MTKDEINSIMDLVYYAYRDANITADEYYCYVVEFARQLPQAMKWAIVVNR